MTRASLAASLGAMALAVAPATALSQAAPAAPAARSAAAPTAPANQVRLAGAYYYGRGQTQSYKEARSWLEKAAVQKHPEAQRRLGEMYAKGLGGKKDRKKALELWRAAEAAGDAYTPILVADLYYQDITGEKDPAPGKFKFVNSVPAAQIDDTISWYEAALARDPRAETKKRAEMALYVLRTLKSASVSVSKR
jgi:TPR repeat protein